MIQYQIVGVGEEVRPRGGRLCNRKRGCENSERPLPITRGGRGLPLGKGGGVRGGTPLSGPTDLQHFGLELLRTAGHLRGAEDRGHRAEVRGRGGCERCRGFTLSAALTHLMTGEALGSLHFLRGDLDGQEGGV